MKDFTGRVAWITGASSGIGEALVYEMVKRGARVIASSNCKPELETVKENCGLLKDRVHIACFDLSDTDNIAELVKEQLGITGRVDYLLNIGGISQRASIEETPMSLHRKIMEINYFGTIALTRAVLPYMLAQKEGHLLATSSIAGRFGFPLRSAYSASKQALHGFFETLYLENRHNNIRASVIIPGRVKTNISRHALLADGSEHGKMDPGLEKGISPEAAARTIIKGIIKNKREIKVGGNELIMLYIRKYFPTIFFNIASKIKPQ